MTPPTRTARRSPSPRKWARRLPKQLRLQATRVIVVFCSIVMAPYVGFVSFGQAMAEMVISETSPASIAPLPLRTRRAKAVKQPLTKARAAEIGRLPPTAEDFTPSAETTLTPAIQKRADKIGPSAYKLAKWVHDHIEYQPYRGSLKGANATLLDKAGNDVDQASLLIAMLRAQAIPSRYVTGQIDLTQQQLAGYLQSASDEVAVGMLEKYGIPYEIEGNILTLQHVWVLAYEADHWSEYLPAVKDHVVTPPADLQLVAMFRPEELAQAASRTAVLTVNKGEAVALKNAEQNAIRQEFDRVTQALLAFGTGRTQREMLGGTDIIRWKSA
jgi:transglutaminase superfamily protein